MDVSNALNTAKNMGIDPLQMASDKLNVSQETLNQGAELVQDVANGKNPLEGVMKFISNATKKPGQVKQGIQNAAEAIGDQVVDKVGEVAQEASGNAAEVFKRDVPPEQVITDSIYFAWLSRIIVFGIVFLWIVISIISNYTELFSNEWKERIQSVNDFINKYLLILIALFMLWSLFTAQITYLPYVGQGIGFFNKLNEAAKTILETFSGVKPLLALAK